PTTTDNKTFDGTGTGSFVSNLTGLTQGTKYYLRAYAGNYAGTAYSEEISFTTLADAAKSTIVTSDISETTQTTANSGGNVTSDGGTPVTERGICWNTSGSPTTADNKKTEGSGTGSFVSSLSGLTPNTTYFLRAYAINEAGISYGVEKTFSTNAASLPVITTTQVLNITQTTAVSGGNVTADGGIVVTARGVCWNLTGNPTISDYKTSEGTGTGTFVSNLTELSPGKNYYLRSYAVNNVGTTYGQELTFSTSQPTCAKPTVSSNNATEILATSVTLNGSVNANGFESALVFEYGFGTDYGYTVNASPNSIATNVNTPITFTLTGLLSNTTYHYRVRAVNCGGTEYGNDQSFTTSCENAISLSADASNISNVTAILNGSVDPNNSSTIVIFEYGLTTSYENTKTANQSPVTGMDAVVVSAELIGLIPNTVYHYRIKSTNCAGTITGIDKTFTTLCNPPVCNASSASSITTTAAYLNGSVNGGDFSTIVTFEYGLTSNPYSSSISATPGTVTGASNTQVGVSLTSLTSGTTYHYRVKAVSCGGVVYSPDIQFTTSCIAPVCSTSAATLIQNTTVTLNGTVNPEGCNSTVVFEYGTTTSYGSTITATQSPISTSGSVNANISELLSGTTYHFRVKSTNSGGTTSASDMTFTTTVKDIDGNVYTKVSIGTQVWMVENLKTSHYRNGSSIPNVTDNTAWINMTSGASCIYSNLWDTYGKLYNWYAVNDSRGLCPLGWHVPTDNEWSTLENYLIANSYNYDGTTIGNKYAKAIASSNDWMSSTTIGAVGNTDYPAKRNATGFSALPGGSRNSLGTFLGYGSYTNFWTSTEDYTAAWTRHFGSNQVSVTRGDGGDYKVAGNTVRCLRGD
ncbi:MAG: FISUMP domain-containing protein, partial [Methanosarcina sp.]